MASIYDICDAVVTALNAGSWSQPFTAVRASRPNLDNEEAASLAVYVVPLGITRDRLNRAGVLDTSWSVGIIVTQRLSAADATAEASIKALVELCDQFDIWFMQNAVTVGADGHEAMAVARDPLFVSPELHTRATFTARVVLTYRTFEG